MGKLFAFVRGVAIGAACMYLLDPNSGRRRRGLIRDKAVKAANNVEQFVNAGGEDLKNRAQGLAAEIQSVATGNTGAQDFRERAMRLSGVFQPMWAPGPRLLACIVGGLTCMSGLRRSGIRRLVMFCCGSALATRAAINRPFNTGAETESITDSDQQATTNTQATGRRVRAAKAA